ncbi:hypothetical protein TNCV_448621 [Trichonephila clavipes]|nr:hypothetical protein TNCV_448621 [Trichonephila clavipes]
MDLELRARKQLLLRLTLHFLFGVAAVASKLDNLIILNLGEITRVVPELVFHSKLPYYANAKTLSLGKVNTHQTFFRSTSIRTHDSIETTSVPCRDHDHSATVITL